MLSAGRDLVERLEETVRWLIGGKMAHLTIFLPGDSPAVAAASPALRELGLFAAGWIPGFYRGGGDALIYQVIAYQTLDPDQVLVAESGLPLKREVVAAWQQVKTSSSQLECHAFSSRHFVNVGLDNSGQCA